MKICCAVKTRRRRAGFSLVEVMVAMLVLSVMTLAGASMLMRSGESMALQANKRAAVEAANRRMELIRSTGATAFDALPLNRTRYLRYNGTTMVMQSNDPKETVLVNGASVPIMSTIQKLESSARGDSSFKSVELFLITVELEYREGDVEDRIVLKSYYR